MNTYILNICQLKLDTYSVGEKYIPDITKYCKYIIYNPSTGDSHYPYGMQKKSQGLLLRIQHAAEFQVYFTQKFMLFMPIIQQMKIVVE